jgi:hypothetical protein
MFRPLHWVIFRSQIYEIERLYSVSYKLGIRIKTQTKSRYGSIIPIIYTVIPIPKCVIQYRRTTQILIIIIQIEVINGDESSNGFS